jgi:DNA (cytosine-5)-methyltransferase 1
MKPDLFVFENVPGLLNMSGGGFLKRIMAGFDAAGYEAQVWKLNAAEYGVPQRRVRVVIVGVRRGLRRLPGRPVEWCSVTPGDFLAKKSAVTVAEAIGDLPRLTAGQDGSRLDYAHAPACAYQALMRGMVSPADYLVAARGRAGKVAA